MTTDAAERHRGLPPEQTPPRTGTSPSADPDERIRRLEARVAEFEASERKPAT